MSLAYKLWKIGNALTERDILDMIRDQPEFKDEPEYLCIEFKVADNQVQSFEITRNAVSKEKFFFTSKMGGSGAGIFYLYPNLALQNEAPLKKFNLLKNTLEKSVLQLCCENNAFGIQTILDFLDNQEMFNPLAEQLKEIEKLSCIFWLSVNGKTIFEIMPEVWNNWLASPAVALAEQVNAKDALTNCLDEVGYRTEFKVFSYDQYHDSLNGRINDNFPLSKESSRAIKLAWIYCLKHLVFYYKGLEYVMLPNLMTDDLECMLIVLTKLALANRKSTAKRPILERLYNQEKKIQKELEKLKKKKQKNADKIRQQHETQKANRHEILQTDLGLVEEVDEQLDCLENLRNMVTVDLIFTAINRTNLSFEVKGSIGDVVPGRAMPLN